MYIVLYLLAIVLANISVARFGPSVAIVNAFLFIGLDLTARDKLHETWRGNGLLWKMAMLIAAGSVLSWVLNRNAGPIALASFVAFAAAASVDAAAITSCYTCRNGRVSTVATYQPHLLTVSYFQ